MAPVGEGAIRVTTGRSDIEVEEPAKAAAPGAWAAPLSTRPPGRPSLAASWAWLGEQAARQGRRWTLWTPVAFGCGAAAYFALLREPQAWVGIAGVALAAVLLLGAARWSASRPLTAAIVILACGLGGFSMAKLRTEGARAPVAGQETRPQRLEGWVVDIASPGAGGPRLLIAPSRIGDWAP